MMLITKAISKVLPKLYSTEKKKPEDIRIYLKLFFPWGRGTWYVTEMDQETGIMFCFVKSPLGPDCDELGYTDINELKAIKGQFGLGLERDMYWDDTTTLAQVMKGDRHF